MAISGEPSLSVSRILITVECKRKVPGHGLGAPYQRLNLTAASQVASNVPKAWFLVLGCNRQDGKGVCRFLCWTVTRLCSDLSRFSGLDLELTLRKRRWQERCPSWKVDRWTVSLHFLSFSSFIFIFPLIRSRDPWREIKKRKTAWSIRCIVRFTARSSIYEMEEWKIRTPGRYHGITRSWS